MILMINIVDKGEGTRISMDRACLPGEEGDELTEREKMLMKRISAVVRKEVETIQSELLASGELKSVTHILRDLD